MESYHIISKFIDHAQNNPHKIALIHKKDLLFFKRPFENVTYHQLYCDMIWTAQKLKEQGIQKKDRILVFVPMSYDLYVIALAILHIGAVLVFVDAWSNLNRLSMACDIVKPVGFIGTVKAQILRLSSAIRQIPLKIISHTLLCHQQGMHQSIDSIPPEHVSADNEAIVTFTTGSTGAPKAAKRTHEFLYNQHLALNAHMPLVADDINLATLPIFVLNNLLIGITTVLPDFNPAKPSEFDPQTVVQQIIDLNVTSSIGSPSFFDYLANYILKTKKATPFKTIYTGGAPIFKPLAKKFRQAFPKADIHVVFGATEVEPVSSIPLDDYIQRDHQFGLPVGKKVHALNIKRIQPTDDEICIDDNHSLQDYEVTGDAVGEIIVSGNHVLKEYIGSPLMFKKNKIISNGQLWHRTGDAGRIDSEGMIYLYGRVKNRFLTKQNQYVFAIPIEQEILTIEAIEFTALFKANALVYVALESKTTLSENEKDQIRSKVKTIVQDLYIHDILFLKTIPRDPRHHSKANYEKLSQYVKGE